MTQNGRQKWTLQINSNKVKNIYFKIKIYLRYKREFGWQFAFYLFLLYLEQQGYLSKFIINSIKYLYYKLWIIKNEPSRSKLTAQYRSVEQLPFQPLISIILPVCRANRRVLCESIDSVLRQSYYKWELIVLTERSLDPSVERVLKRYAAGENRIKIYQKKEGYGTVTEIITLSQGDQVGFIGCGDILAPFAFFEVVSLLTKKPDLDLIYSDEDSITEYVGMRFAPFFKTGWGPLPDTLRSFNYFGKFAISRKVLLNSIRGFQENFEGANEYDLFLKVSELSNNIGHIPKILYHRRSNKDSLFAEADRKSVSLNTQRAVDGHLRRLGINGQVFPIPKSEGYKISYNVINNPIISIIIPTKDKVEALKRCVDSVHEKSTYKNYEIIIVDNQSHESPTKDYFNSLRKERNRIKVVNYDFPFNFSSINNYGVQYAHGDILLFLNNDVEVITSDWLDAMLEYAQRSDVGAVGPKLYYPNKTAQSAGVVIGATGSCAEPYKFSHMDGLPVVRNVSAVTGACLMTRKDVFEQMGGFDDDLAVDYNDVDLCVRMRSRGYVIVWTPYAELYHYERLTRGSPVTHSEWDRKIRERRYLLGKWQNAFENGDPYYSVGL